MGDGVAVLQEMYPLEQRERERGDGAAVVRGERETGEGVAVVRGEGERLSKSSSTLSAHSFWQRSRASSRRLGREVEWPRVCAAMRTWLVRLLGCGVDHKSSDIASSFLIAILLPNIQCRFKTVGSIYASKLIYSSCLVEFISRRPTKTLS